MNDPLNIASLADSIWEINREMTRLESLMERLTEQRGAAYSRQEEARKSAFEKFMRTWSGAKAPAAAQIEQFIDQSTVKERTEFKDAEWKQEANKTRMYSAQSRLSGLQTLAKMLSKEAESWTYQSDVRESEPFGLQEPSDVQVGSDSGTQWYPDEDGWGR